MKTVKYIAMMAVAGMMTVAVSSCEDMLDTKSDDYILEEDMHLAVDGTSTRSPRSSPKRT